MIFSTKQYLKDKKISASKKVHRRVITQMLQMQEPQQFWPFKPELKKPDKLPLKNKFIDVYSKYVIKDSITQRRNFKIYQNKPTMTQKLLRTEPDEAVKHNILASQHQKIKTSSAKYQIEGVAGKGTFGVVYFGTDRSTGQKIAIKKVFQDKKYKNREHQILKLLKHPNNLVMKDSFLTNQGQDEYLNIVMDYFGDNLYQVVNKKQINPILIKLYSYQIFRGLNYLAMMSIAHRDIKPQNILVDKLKHKVIISDFGSAKQLVKNQPNLAYICSRCYRAPQLIFGATDYIPQIDMWSTGCVLVQMINGIPPFMGDSQVDQLIQIIKILGTPSKIDVEQMNKLYDMKQYSKFPKIKTAAWKNLLQSKDALLIDLVTKILVYSPYKRITPGEALLHEYFDELRDEARYKEILLRVKAIPQLFDFSQDELNFINQKTNNNDLVPSWTIKRTVHLNTTANKLTCASTNTKRSVISFKAM